MVIAFVELVVFSGFSCFLLSLGMAFFTGLVGRLDWTGNGCKGGNISFENFMDQVLYYLEERVSVVP